MKNQLRVFFRIIILSLAFSIIFTSLAHAQNQAKIDSILQLVNAAKEDTNQLKLLLELGAVYENLNPDTALYFYDQALDLSERIDAKEFKAQSLIMIGFNHQTRGSSEQTLEYFEQALEICEEIKDTERISRCYVNIGLVYHDQGSYNAAIDYYLKALASATEAGHKAVMTFTYNNLGRAFFDQGSYQEAIDYYLKALKIQEETGDKRGMASSYNNIGLIHYEQASFDRAIEFLLKALAINEELGRKRGMSICYHNIGMVYQDQASYDKAIEYYAKGLLMFEELGHQRGISISNHALGISHLRNGSYDQASEYFFEALEGYEDLEDKMGIAQSNVSIANLNIVLADSVAKGESRRITYLNEAVKHGNTALELAAEMELMPVTEEAASTLKSAYTKLGKYRKALESADLLITARDSMFKEEKTRAIQEMSTKYESDKKQQQIELQESQILAKDASIKQQKAYRNALAIGFAAVVIIVVVIVYAYVQKQKSNRKIMEQNEHILEANEELKVLNEAINTQNSEIIDSINYAKRIQSAMLPPETYITELLNENFIFYRPRDIVSGDFYWIKQVNQYIVLVAADCTGHGVPGAFMSMLGISFLNEIVQRREITQANQVLNELRKQVKYSLRQHGQKEESKDGIDIALCVLDLKNSIMQFAGAYNPLYLIRDVEGRPELMETKGDRMPLGYYQGKDKSFTNHEIPLEMGDTFYVFSDGFMDQKGGKDKKKYMSKNFKRLLLDIHEQPLYEQKEILSNTLEQWMGDSSQIDDILIIGARI